MERRLDMILSEVLHLYRSQQNHLHMQRSNPRHAPETQGDPSPWRGSRLGLYNRKNRMAHTRQPFSPRPSLTRENSAR